MQTNTIPPTTREYANHLAQALSEQMIAALRARLKLANEDEKGWLTQRVQVVIGEIKSLVEVMK